MWSDGQRGRKIINYKESERDRQTGRHTAKTKKQDKQRRRMIGEREREKRANVKEN